jgi:Flp pilus assembly protein TadG
VSRRTRAQVIVWVAVMMPVFFLPIIGLTIEAGVMFDARRNLQNVADGAARVGAMEITVADSGAVHIAPGAAHDAVEAYLDRVHFSGDQDIDTRNDRVLVRLERQQRTLFLRLVHVNDWTIHATGRAVACSGVVEATSICT